jgi:hypothetical protein
MIEELATIVSNTSSRKISFPDEIKAQTDEGAIYISEIKLVLNNLMVKVEYKNDTAFRNIKDLAPNVVAAIYNVVTSFVKKRKAA